MKQMNVHNVLELVVDALSGFFSNGEVGYNIYLINLVFVSLLPIQSLQWQQTTWISLRSNPKQ